MNILDYTNSNVGEFRVSDSIDFDRLVDSLTEGQRLTLARKIAHEREEARGDIDTIEEIQDKLSAALRDNRKLELRIVDLVAQLKQKAG